MSKPRMLTDDELKEIGGCAGTTFGEGERPYYIADLLYTAEQCRQALRALALNGTMDSPLWSWCDEGWLCQHRECMQARWAVTANPDWWPQ